MSDVEISVTVAADIGYGTGLSARAVRNFAELVVAIDAPQPMLLEAEQHP